MTEKDLAKQAYLAYQDKLNSQVGDTVKVLFSVPDYASGWDNSWTPEMNDFVRKTFRVLEVLLRRGIKLHRGLDPYSWLFPAFCLEVVSRKCDEKPDEKMIKVGDKEFSESEVCDVMKTVQNIRDLLQ